MIKRNNLKNLIMKAIFRTLSCAHAFKLRNKIKESCLLSSLNHDFKTIKNYHTTSYLKISSDSKECESNALEPKVWSYSQLFNF